jgi:hypothetical protein
MGFGFWLWWVSCNLIAVVVLITFATILFSFSFLGIKVIVGVNLVSYATGRWAGMEARQAEDDAVNDFGRYPIGEGKEEQVHFTFYCSIYR